MNLILLTDTDFINAEQAVLNDRRHQQILQVHGSSAGDTVRVGKLGGLMGEAVIDTISTAQTTLNVSLTQPPPEKLPLRIVLALPRPKMIRRIFRTVAELGVEELIIINSYKVEKSYWQSPVLSSNNTHEYFIDGLQQAKDTVMPALRFEKRFKPFVEDELPHLIAGQQALLAHPNQGRACPHPLNQRATLAIGPEGGFTDYEASKLLDAGFSGIHLGQRILKVETALTSLIAKLYS